MKLLVVRLSALGDVVHALPALELLRGALPEARLAWAVESLASPLLVGHPALDEAIVLPRREAFPGRLAVAPRGVLALGRALGRLRATRWDVALDLQGLLRSALVARASGAARVLGPAWAPEGAALLYREPLAAPRPGEAHASARAEALVRGALAALGARPPVGPLPPPRLPAALAAPAGPPSLILLPGAGKPANRPLPETLAAVADRCAQVRPELEVLLVGGPSDRPLAAEVARRCRVARPQDRCGALDLAGSARLLAGARLVVGGDTGPLHLARALGRPVLALFGPADPARTGPSGVPGPAAAVVLQGEAACAPCFARRCRRPDRRRVCLEALAPGAVAAAAEALLLAG